MIGIDPSAFTLRELMLMAGERKRVMGELAAWHISIIAGMFGGNLSPGEINPYRVVPEAEREAKAALEKQRFWAALEVGIFGRRVTADKPKEPK